MKKVLALAFTLLCGSATAQGTFPLNNIPIGKGPGKSGFTPVTPVDGQCFSSVAGVPTFVSCTGLLSGSALTKTDDTNVTLTLGGSPNTALVNAASLTLGWTGTLAYTRGGCNAATQVACRNNIFPTPSAAGDIVYWNGSAWVILPGNTTGTRVLQETSAGAPSWVAPGTVTSIGITPSPSLSVSGSPVTGSGNITITYRPPTIQTFTGSASGTYTTPANVSAIKVSLCGATGGGAGSGTGTTGGSGGTPSASTFSGGTLSCAGGNGGTASVAGTGSTCTGTGYILPGKDGQAVSTGVAGNFIAGSLGGNSPLFGNQGGRGGFFNGAGNTGGGGGGAGCIVNYISSPAASYTYSLSAGGTAGTAGTSGSVGIVGDAARLTVEEF